MSKPLSAVDCISPAFSQTKNQLFAPFRLERWGRLALVCLILGDFAGGGGGPSAGFHPPSLPRRGGHGPLAIPRIEWGRFLPWLPWVLAGAALVLLLIFLWVYIASVYRFVLFDSVLYNRCELKGSWQRWEPPGRSFFCWCLALFVGSLTGAMVLIAAPLLIAWHVGLFHHPGAHLFPLVLGGVTLLLALIAFMVLCAVAGMFAKDFCVPIMALEKVGVMDAWRRFLPMLAQEKLAFAGYVLMKIVLGLGFAIIFGILTIAGLIAMLIPLGIITLIIIFGGKAIGLTWSLGTAGILAILGIIVLTGIFYLIAFISTPAMVFFQSYVLHFLGSRYPALSAVLFPPPDAPPPPAIGEPAIR